MTIKNIFFDFDGVLAESLHVKTKAFYDLYLPYGKEIAEKVVKHHRNNGGVSRFEKFKIYHDRFLDQQIDEDQVEELAQRFSDLVVDGVVESPEVEGSIDFLDKYEGLLAYWIITGTPTDEILEITERRGIRHYFNELCGSPTKKTEWAAYLIDKYNLLAEETLFLGDAVSDFKAAEKNNLHFALRETEENKTLFKDFDGIRFKNFHDLEQQISF